MGEQFGDARHHPADPAWRKLSPLLPDYIRRECTECPQGVVQSNLVGKAAETLDWVENGFSDAVAADPRWQSIAAMLTE